MQFKKVLNSRASAVVMGAAVIAVLGASAGFAAGTIGSNDIIDNSVQGRDVKDGSLQKKDLTDDAVAKLNGNTGPQGPKGPVGPSSIVAVDDLDGDWTIRAADLVDAEGAQMTGDGIKFGPFANAGACDGGGLGYARLDYDGNDGDTLSSLKSLVLHASYTADDDTHGVGVPVFRVYFSGNENGSAGNRLTFSPNTQPDGDFAEGAMHEWVVTSGNVRLNDDTGNHPELEASWDSFMDDYGTRAVENINVLVGCTAGTDLTGLVRRIEINGTTFAFGAV